MSVHEARPTDSGAHGAWVFARPPALWVRMRPIHLDPRLWIALLAMWIFLQACAVGNVWVEYINDMPVGPPPPPIPGLLELAGLLLLLAVLSDREYRRTGVWLDAPRRAAAWRLSSVIVVGFSSGLLTAATVMVFELLGREGFGTFPFLPPAPLALAWIAPFYAVRVARQLRKGSDMFVITADGVQPTQYGIAGRRSPFIRSGDIRGACLAISEAEGRPDVLPRFEWTLWTQGMGKCSVDGEAVLEHSPDDDHYLRIVEAVIAANRSMGGRFIVSGS